MKKIIRPNKQGPDPANHPKFDKGHIWLAASKGRLNTKRKKLLEKMKQNAEDRAK